jgi:hypothetical protein
MSATSFKNWGRPDEMVCHLIWSCIDQLSLSSTQRYGVFESNVELAYQIPTHRGITKFLLEKAMASSQGNAHPSLLFLLKQRSKFYLDDIVLPTIVVY